jgi:mono/diheme cytochrome c family protein
MPRSLRIAVGGGTLVVGAVFVVTVRTAASPPAVALSPMTSQADRSAQSRSRPADGQTIFRFDTFGDEQLWTDHLQMHVVIESAVDPLTALDVGLKVDVEAIPPEVRRAISAGRVDLTNPATTVALIKLNAVVGVVGKVEKINGRDRLTEVGITCALCHSTVDDSFMPGIGRRLDGWPNLDLDPGRIIGLSPAISTGAKQVYDSWGPGKYDPRFNIDGLNTPLVIPPAYGLANVDKETFTGEGPISYWNNYVAVTQMGGKGSFSDPLLGINIVQTPDLVQPKLPALRDYQLSLPKPPPPNSFDQAAAAQGQEIFLGVGQCATCHIPPLYTDVNDGILHDPAKTGMNPAYAERTTTKQYRTTPLRALWQHAPYFHDGSAATLRDVVEHYNAFLLLGLTDDQMRDLVEFLKSI